MSLLNSKTVEQIIFAKIINLEINVLLIENFTGINKKITWIFVESPYSSTPLYGANWHCQSWEKPCNWKVNYKTDLNCTKMINSAFLLKCQAYQNKHWNNTLLSQRHANNKTAASYQQIHQVQIELKWQCGGTTYYRIFVSSLQKKPT